MQKLILYLILQLSVSGFLFAQFTATNCVRATQLNVSLSQMDEVFVCNGISSAPQVSYNHTTTTNFNWYKYTTNPAAKVWVQTDNNVQSTTLSSPDLEAGYVLEFDGQSKYIWFTNIKSHNYTVDSLYPSRSAFPCVTANVGVRFASLGEIAYYNSAAAKKIINRVFTISYNSLVWNESNSSYSQKLVSVQKEVIGSGKTISNFTVDAPLVNTKFYITGDQFLTALNANPPSYDSFYEYQTVAVEQHLEGLVSERESTNEIDRKSGALGGSAPLNVELKSNANTPTTRSFEWYITSKEDPNNQVYYTDRDLRYTFKKTGLYIVKLVASNAECSTTDTLTVNVISSSLEVPNVFTPNGDGKNDEFRVAYKSLVKFSGVVYNRWGRKVYQWTDPGKGWDGRIAGRLAAPGAYYYIIEAVGSDLDSNTNKPIQYKKKGDINLIRGK